MLTIKGKYNEAICYTEQVDDATIGQIMTLCNLEFLKKSKIRIMPDTHAGTGCVIGTTMTLQDKVVPNLVGVDIGCGLHVVKLKQNVKLDFDKLDKTIRNRIPNGSGTHDLPVAAFNLDEVLAPIRRGYAARSLGTLGGGNHFIEVNKGKDGIYLVIHSGSRVLGKDIAEYHQEVAYESLSLVRKQLKIAAKKQPELMAEREKLKLPYELSFLEKEKLATYLADMHIAQQFAARNRFLMAEVILKAMKWSKHVVSRFDCPHNYIDLEQNMLRKGATSAQAGEQIIVPLNMRDGSILAVGKGNPNWNSSAPHGAGRLLSRTKAKESITLESYQRAMKGIFTTSVSKKTLDEAPKAYKSAKQLEKDVVDTMDIQEIIRPLYNFKA
ncbi:RtcB family protein [Listeria sp. ILCC792]|uniref:RtcB family protein n=1 Tax=Listeria sp. ILCC792 TaxID=1918331 RepID=UPI000B58E343|nr:RtcB family protein [Listeria sp. ILCC792]